MGVPNSWMLYNGKSLSNGYGGTPILGNLHIYINTSPHWLKPPQLALVLSRIQNTQAFSESRPFQTLRPVASCCLHEGRPGRHGCRRLHLLLALVQFAGQLLQLVQLWHWICRGGLGQHPGSNVLHRLSRGDVSITRPRAPVRKSTFSGETFQYLLE